MFQSRKMLYRAGSFLQEAFYMYREKVFDKEIIRIEEAAGKLRIHEAPLTEGPKIDVDFLHRFPTALFSGPEKEQKKKALLTMLACTDAMAWMHDLAKYLLNGQLPKELVC